jgi:hypothetical protein
LRRIPRGGGQETGRSSPSTSRKGWPGERAKTSWSLPDSPSPPRGLHHKGHNGHGRPNIHQLARLRVTFALHPMVTDRHPRFTEGLEVGRGTPSSQSQSWSTSAGVRCGARGGSMQPACTMWPGYGARTPAAGAELLPRYFSGCWSRRSMTFSASATPGRGWGEIQTTDIRFSELGVPFLRPGRQDSQSGPFPSAAGRPVAPRAGAAGPSGATPAPGAERSRGCPAGTSDPATSCPVRGRAHCGRRPRGGA